MLALVAAALAPLDLSPDPSWPSVSIIVPTNSRPEFVGRMLEMVAAQDYDLERLQVVVVDDSPPELRAPALAAGEQRLGAMHVIYVLLPAVVSIGEKRCPEEAEHAGITEPFWRDGVASLFAGGGAFDRIQRRSNEIWWTLRFPFGSFALETSPGVCEKLWVQPIGRRLAKPIKPSCPYYTEPLQWTTVPGGCPSLLLLQHGNGSGQAERLLDSFVPVLSEYVKANGTHFGYYMVSPALNRATSAEGKRICSLSVVPEDNSDRSCWTMSWQRCSAGMWRALPSMCP